MAYAPFCWVHLRHAPIGAQFRNLQSHDCQITSKNISIITRFYVWSKLHPIIRHVMMMKGNAARENEKLVHRPLFLNKWFSGMLEHWKWLVTQNILSLPSKGMMVVGSSHDKYRLGKSPVMGHLIKRHSQQ